MDDEGHKKIEAPYKQILKPTFIMGGSSIINSLLAIVRIKFIAIALGPSGVGLIGIYHTTVSLVSTLCCMGIGESGTRQIAGASGAGEQDKIARTFSVIRSLALFSGFLGCIILFFLRNHISLLTFGNQTHAFDIAVLSLSIFFTAVYSGQLSLIQGLRIIGDLAKVNILGALFGTILCIPIIHFFGESGVAYYFLIVSATGVLTSWWYSRKIKVPVVALFWKDSVLTAKPLLILGLALMLGTLLSLFTQYWLRVFIIRYNDIEAAGVYHAAMTLSTVYVGIILRAMMTDFYPRLSATSHDHDQCRYLINKQIEVGLLLAFPGILAIMTFAPFVIALFYSPKFMQSVDILRWQILGVLLQVVNWPMGVMLRAKGNGKLFLWTELFANGVLVGLSYLGFLFFGLPGIGMAFFGMNILYGILIFSIVARNYSFSFSLQNLEILTLFVFATGVIFLTPYFLYEKICMVINTIITLGIGMCSLVIICKKTDTDMVPAFIIKFMARLGLNVK